MGHYQRSLVSALGRAEDRTEAQAMAEAMWRARPKDKIGADPGIPDLVLDQAAAWRPLAVEPRAI